MAEWSKAMDSSPITERCVGSNPTGTNFFVFIKLFFKVSIFFLSIILVFSPSRVFSHAMLTVNSKSLTSNLFDSICLLDLNCAFKFLTQCVYQYPLLITAIRKELHIGTICSIEFRPIDLAIFNFLLTKKSLFNYLRKIIYLKTNNESLSVIPNIY